MIAVTAYGWACAGTFLASVAAPMAFLEWDHRRRHRRNRVSPPLTVVIEVDPARFDDAMRRCEEVLTRRHVEEDRC